MIPSLGSTPYAAQTGSSSSSSSSNLLNPAANEQAFLQLLVAQLKNQDPTQPQDGTQFVAELAQFTSVSEELGMKQDLDSMNSILVANQSFQAGQSASSGSSPTGGTSQP